MEFSWNTDYIVDYFHFGKVKFLRNNGTILNNIPHLFHQHYPEQHLKSSDFGCFLLFFATF